MLLRANNVSGGSLPLFVIAMVCLGLYGVASLVHLYFVYNENEAGRRLTKIIPLVLLSIASLFLLADGEIFYLPAILGFLFSIAGDFLFLYKKKGTVYLMTGTILFFLAHVFFLIAIGVFFPERASFFPWSILYLSMVAVAAWYPVHRIVKNKWSISLVGGVYFAFVTGLLFYFVLRFFDPECPYSVLETSIGLVGAVLFITSDLLNFITLFVKDIKRRDFYIMVPYLIAQLLLFTSFILLPYLGV